MANLIPQSGNQWMRWIERRLSSLETRRGGGGTPSPPSPISMRQNRVPNGGNMTVNTSEIKNILATDAWAGYDQVDPQGIFSWVNGGTTTYPSWGWRVSQAGIYEVNVTVNFNAVGTSTGVAQLFIFNTAYNPDANPARARSYTSLQSNNAGLDGHALMYLPANGMVTAWVSFAGTGSIIVQGGQQSSSERTDTNMQIARIGAPAT